MPKPEHNPFIDDEAELSEDEIVSSDEDENDNDEAEVIEGLLDDDAQDLDSDQEEQVRTLYHKQRDLEDRRELLVLKEHVEDINYTQARRKRFKWQTKTAMELNLKRHYHPDDEDDNEDEDDDDDLDDLETEFKGRIKKQIKIDDSDLVKAYSDSYANPRKDLKTDKFNTDTEDSNTNTNIIGHADIAKSKPINSDITQFVYRDKELVTALSKQTAKSSTEDKEKMIQRDFNRVLQAKSVFDELF